MTARPLAPDEDRAEAGRRSTAARVEREATRDPEFFEWAISKERPRMAVEQGIYRVSWDQPVFTMLEFDYLHNSRSSGDITAELTIVVGGPTDKGHYQKTRLNLLADSSVSRLAGSLDKRMPALKIPWATYLNDAVQWVLHQYRAGEPGVYLDDVPEEEQAAAPVFPLFAADGHTVIFGDGEATKSYLALASAGSLTSGLEVISGLVPDRAMKVGYLDWEWKPARHARRLRALWQPIDAPLPKIRYVKCTKPITEERDRLRREVRDHGLEFLIVDSVGYACAGAAEEQENAMAFFRTLEQIGLPSLCLAHVNRQDAKNGADKPFGSAFWHNSARATWYIKRSEQDSLDGTVSVALFERKNSESSFKRTMGLRWHFSDEHGTTVGVSAGAIAEEPSLVSQLSVPKRMVLLLKAGPMTIHNIAEELDASIDAVRKGLTRGEAFVKLPSGGGVPERWGLAARE